MWTTIWTVFEKLWALSLFPQSCLNLSHSTQYLKYHTKYHATKGTQLRIAATTGNSTNSLSRRKFFFLRNFYSDAIIQEHSTTERWMTQVVKKAKPATSNGEGQVSDPFAELNRFFESDALLRTECPDIVAWYGVSLRLLVAESIQITYYLVVEID
jgi:hypothetical protein